MSVAIVYAGQGQPPSRALVELALADALGRALVERALALAGTSLDELFARGGRVLERTEVVQPLVVALSVAVSARLGLDRGGGAEVHLGHSLGELSALAAAGALEPMSAVELAARRGAAMGAAARARPGGLAAIAPADARAATAEGATVALDNAPDELVIGADEPTLRSIGGRVSCLRLSVAGAWHTSLMEPARDAFSQAVEAAGLCSPRRSLVSAVDVEPVSSAARAETCLVSGLVRPVRFREALASLVSRGVAAFIVVGPARALRGIVRRNAPAARVWAVECEGELQAARVALGGTP